MHPPTIIAPRPLLLPHSHHLFSNQELISIAATAKNSTQAWSLVMGSSEPRWLAAHGGSKEEEEEEARRKLGRQESSKPGATDVWAQLFEPPASFPLARSLPPSLPPAMGGRERADRSSSTSTSTSSTGRGRWPPSCVVLGQGVAALAAPRASRGGLLLPSWWHRLSQYQQRIRLTNLQFLQTSAGRYCGKTMMTINLIKETKYTISFKSQHWLTEWSLSSLVSLKL